MAIKKLLIFIFSIFITLTLRAEETSMNHLDIVKSTYEGDSSKDNAENLMHFLDENVQWTEAAGFPLAGVYHGKEEIQQKVFKPLGELWNNYQFKVEKYIAGESNSNNESSIVALGTYTGIYKATNKSFVARVAHHWTLRDNRIISFEQFVDSVPVVQAMN